MSITPFISKLFNIRPGEWKRLSLLYTMDLFVLTGLTWCDYIVEASFLQKVGVRYLPWVFISCATCSIIALFIYTAFADRMSNTRLLLYILAISGVGMVLGVLVVGAGYAVPGYLLLFLMLNVPLLDLFNVHMGTYVNQFYDIRAAKRIIPVLGTAARFAGIIAGLTMPLINRVFTPSAILLLGVSSLAVMGAIAAAMPRLMHEGQPALREAAVISGARPGDGAQSRMQKFSADYVGNLREGYHQATHSPFLLWLALSTLSMTVLLAFLNYGASAILQAELKTTVAISDFIGILAGVANLVVLPIQMFVLSRIINRLGLGKASMIYPAVSVGIAGSIAFAPVLPTAALAYLDRTALRTAFRLPIENLLYNAVPQRVKARTRAFVGGLVVPIGTILSGILLLTPLVRMPWFLPAATLTLGLAFVIAGWMVSRHYGQALVDLLEQEDYSSLAFQPPALQEPTDLASDPETLARLTQKLSESASPERTVFLAQLITATGGAAAVQVVGQAARAAGDSRLRASLLDVFVAADVRRGGVRELYEEFLADPSATVRLSAISGLEQIDGPRDARYLEFAAQLLSDPETEVRLRVLPALLAADDQNRRAAGAAELRALLKSAEPHTRAQAVQAIGQTGDFGFLLELVRSLTDSEDEVRLAAGLATEALVKGEQQSDKRNTLLALALLLLCDPVEQARLSAVTVLSRLSNAGGPAASAARESLVSGLADSSQEVRQQAVEALVPAGRRSLRLVSEHLDADDLLLRKMTAIVLARIEPHKYASLVISSCLNDTLFSIYRNLCCLYNLDGCPGPATAILVYALQEQNTELVHEVFYLLSTIQNPMVSMTIEHSLRSDNAQARANAIEALESLTAPWVASLIGPLFEPDQPPGLAQALARQTWDLLIPSPVAALRHLLETSDGWQRVLIAAALAELSKTISPGTSEELNTLLRQVEADPDAGVRAELCAAPVRDASQEEGQQRSRGLSQVERIVFLKGVPFFTGLSINQLHILSAVCDEEQFPLGTQIFDEGDPGGTFYIVTSGRVGIEQEKRKDSFARIATLDAPAYLGEAEFFDNNRHTTSALAIQDTGTLRLRRNPLIALARQHPDLSLELINVLSARLRQANERIVELTQVHPRELHKLYDQLG